MGAVATVKHASFEGVRTGRRISVVVRKGGNEQLLRERLVVSRATALLTMFNRGTVVLPAHKRLLIEPRIRIADHIVRKLHHRVNAIESGTHHTRSTCKLVVRLAKKLPFWPLDLLTLACTNTNPTECAQILERVFVGMNSDLTRLRPKSMAHLLPEQ